MKFKFLKTALTCLIFAISGIANAGLIGWTTSGGSVNAGYNGTVGHSLIVNSTIFVDSLGVFDHLGDGLESTSMVGIWTNSGTLLASANILAGTSGTLIDRYRFASISSLKLGPGTYRIGAVLTNAAAYYNYSNLVATNTDVMIDISTRWVASGTNTLQFSPNLFSGDPTRIIYDAANLTYTLAQDVPEPSTLAIFALGMLGLASRRFKKQS